MKRQNYAVIWSQMIISSQSKLTIESKHFCYKSCKAHKPKERYKINSRNYTVIWSQMFFLSQVKLSIESKKFFNNSFKIHQFKGGYEIT